MRVEQIGACTLVGFDKTAVVYAISKDSNSDILYIGSTVNPIKHRVRSHIRSAKSGSILPIHDWIRKVDFKFFVRKLGAVEECNRHNIEKEFVSIFLPTLNITDGGAGLSGHKFAGTEHAKKISEKLKTGSTFKCNRCLKSFWRKLRDIKLGHNKYCSRVCSNRRNHVS